MLGTDFKANRTRVPSLAVALLAAAALMPSVGVAQAVAKELTVKISHVRALDKFDEFSKGDLYAKVTIDGDVQSTPVDKGENNIKPNWKITKKVSSGEHKVKIEVLDKDVTQDDAIDINRVDKKRDLDFTVTSNCRIEGFSSAYKCGSTIMRAGQEAKKAEITFSVDVK